MTEFVYQPLKWELREYQLVAMSTAVEGGYYAIDALPNARRNGPDGWERLPFTELHVSVPFGRYEDGALKSASQKMPYSISSFWTALEVAENTERTAQLAIYEARVNGRNPVSVVIPGGQEYVVGGDDASADGEPVE